MTDVRNTGYQAAAQIALDSELNTLADDTWSSLSPEIDNSLFGYLFMDIEFDLASFLPSGADATVELYLVPSIDDTQFPTYTETGSSDEQENNQYFVGSVTLPPDTEVHIHSIRGIEMPPGKFKLGVRNRANLAFASSGNTVKWRPWSYKSA